MKSFVSAFILAAVSMIAVPALAQRPAQPPPKKSEPAPKRDLTGAWSGPVIPRKEPVPPMTPWGQKLFDEAKPLQGPRAVALAKSTDPLVKCDPLGFPRSILYETRGFQFEHLPKRTLQLLQYQRVWREIWTD